MCSSGVDVVADPNIVAAPYVSAGVVGLRLRSGAKILFHDKGAFRNKVSTGFCYIDTNVEWPYECTVHFIDM